MPHKIVLAGKTDFAGWRDHARALIAADIPPEQVSFVTQDDAPALFEDAPPALAERARDAEFRVPRRFVELAEEAALHRDADRFDLLYRILWRLRREPLLLDLASAP